jgi:hypothetical protein
MRTGLNLTVKLIGVMVGSFVLIMLAHRLALLMPGTVKVSHWKTGSALVFIAAVIPFEAILIRAKVFWGIKILVGIIGAALLLFFAFGVSATSRCGDEPIYIGTKAAPTQVASCE